MQRQNKYFKIFNYSLFTILSFVMLYPFLYTLIGSFTPYNKLIENPFPIFPNTFPQFDAYISILKGGTIVNAYKVTIFITVVGVVFDLFLTFLGAYALSLKDLPGRRVFSILVLVTMFFSGGVIPTYLVLNEMHLIDNIMVYILPTLINTFYLLVIKTNFQEIPVSVREAAEIDGCSHFGILFRIYVPLSLPTLATIALFYAVDRWNELYTALYYITDYKLYSLQGVLYNMLSAIDPATSPIANAGGAQFIEEQMKYAAVILSIVPIICVYPFLQRYFIKGVMIGSVKE